MQTNYKGSHLPPPSTEILSFGSSFRYRRQTRSPRRPSATSPSPSLQKLLFRDRGNAEKLFLISRSHRCSHLWSQGLRRNKREGRDAKSRVCSESQSLILIKHWRVRKNVWTSKMDGEVCFIFSNTRWNAS